MKVGVPNHQCPWFSTFLGETSTLNLWSQRLRRWFKYVWYV